MVINWACQGQNLHINAVSIHHISTPPPPPPPPPKKFFLCARRNFGRHIEIAPSVCYKSCLSDSSLTAPGTSGGILKSHRPSVRLLHKSCLSDSSLTTKANLMKLHRIIKDNEKVCSAHDLGSHAQAQGHNQVWGQNRVSAVTQKLLKQI